MIDNARLETLESQCAHLERAIQELSDVVYRQQQQLDRTLARSEALAAQLEAQLASQESAAEAAGGPRAEIPPHY